MKRILWVLAFVVCACGEDPVPKPKGQLRLDYPEAEYSFYETKHCFYGFEKNELALVKQNDSCSLELHYPKMKATVYLNYKKVNNNVEDLLRDAQKLTYDHTIKADGILEQPFVNNENRVFGMFYQVGGNAATNAQFYITDSIKHFLVGSLYFYARPNYDSILPAADYVKNDMRLIMETNKWK